jgi:hypothetical protein
MRAFPPIDFALNHFGWWRGALRVLALAAVATTLAWLVARAGQSDPLVVAFASLAALLGVACALSAARTPPRALRWDGSCWLLSTPGSAAASEARHGEVQVAIDLGFWMLLRFVATSGPHRVVWLPVQRRGLESHWHALRCAVHGPRPQAPP